MDNRTLSDRHNHLYQPKIKQRRDPSLSTIKNLIIEQLSVANLLFGAPVCVVVGKSITLEILVYDTERGLEYKFAIRTYPTPKIIGVDPADGIKKPWSYWSGRYADIAIDALIDDDNQQRILSKLIKSYNVKLEYDTIYDAATGAYVIVPGIRMPDLTILRLPNHYGTWNMTTRKITKSKELVPVATLTEILDARGTDVINRTSYTSVQLYSLTIVSHSEDTHTIQYGRWSFKYEYDTVTGPYLYDISLDDTPVIIRMSIADITIQNTNPKRPGLISVFGGNLYRNLTVNDSTPASEYIPYTTLDEVGSLCKFDRAMSIIESPTEVSIRYVLKSPISTTFSITIHFRHDGSVTTSVDLAGTTVQTPAEPAPWNEFTNIISKVTCEPLYVWTVTTRIEWVGVSHTVVAYNTGTVNESSINPKGLGMMALHGTFEPSKKRAVHWNVGPHQVRQPEGRVKLNARMSPKSYIHYPLIITDATIARPNDDMAPGRDHGPVTWFTGVQLSNLFRINLVIQLK